MNNMRSLDLMSFYFLLADANRTRSSSIVAHSHAKKLCAHSERWSIPSRQISLPAQLDQARLCSDSNVPTQDHASVRYSSTNCMRRCNLPQRLYLSQRGSRIIRPYWEILQFFTKIMRNAGIVDSRNPRIPGIPGIPKFAYP